MSKPQHKADCLAPSIQLLSKLGGIVAHFDRFVSSFGVAFDRGVMEQLVNDPEVKTWLEQMAAMSLLPAKR